MKKDNLVYLTDMIDSVNAIKRYVGDKSENDFFADPILCDAVFRRYMVLGEAANRLSSDFIAKNHSLPIREAVSIRNLLIHEYNAIKLEKVWESIQNDLPGLEIELEKLILEGGK